MEGITSYLTWPLIGLGILIALFVLVRAIGSFYIRVPPNRAAYFYGSRSGKKGAQQVTQPGTATGAATATVLPPGTIVVTGGGRIRRPIIEEVQFLDLTEITLPQIRVENMPNIDGVLVTVDAVANIRFKDDAESLLAAGARFLGMRPETIQGVARETLEANLRGVIGTLTVDQLIKDREAFRQKVLTEAGEDLSRLGMQIDVFNPQSITDEQGYIEALGKKRTAEVKRDATIGEAEATAEATKRRTDAEREAEIVNQSNEQKKAEAEKNTHVAKQQYAAEVQTETAKAEQAGPLATAQARQEVVVQEVKVEEAKAKAQIGVEEQNILREQKAQEARVVVPAKAKADAEVREAEGYKQSQTARADGDKYATIARADATAHKEKVEGEAEAAAQKAKGLAAAEVTKETGLAEAEVIKQKGLAEAEALEKKAEAYKKFEKEALILEVMKQLPTTLESAATIFGAIAAPMGNVDKIIMYDGGGNGDGKSVINRLMGTGPALVNQLLEGAKAAGIDLDGVFEFMKMNVSGATSATATTSSKEE